MKSLTFIFCILFFALTVNAQQDTTKVEQYCEVVATVGC